MFMAIDERVASPFPSERGKAKDHWWFLQGWWD